MVKEAEEFAEEDKKVKERMDARNQLGKFDLSVLITCIYTGCFSGNKKCLLKCECNCISSITCIFLLKYLI